MKKILTLIIFSALLFGCMDILAQDLKDKIKDKEKSKNEESTEYELFEDFELWESFSFSSSKITSPTIQVIGGKFTPSIHESMFAEDNWKTINGIEVRVGDTRERTLRWSADNIIKYSYSYPFVSYFDIEWNSASENKLSRNEYSANSLRFGFVSSEGYGYKIGDDGSIVLYNSGGINWTRIRFQLPTNSNDPNVLSNNTEFKTFDNTFRFGGQFEAGIKIRLFKPIAITAGYERSMVYPRHLLWKWAVSEIFEGAGHGLLGTFSKAIMKSSPTAGPIVNFVLQNGLSYLFYELRKDNMNWPYNTATPFMYDAFKVGVSLEF